jgi:hypothetical protein
VGRKAARVQRRCSYKNVDSHCPNECGTCDKYACTDSKKAWFYWGKKGGGIPRTCEFVKRKPRLIEKRCGRNGVAATCRETCGWCD